jgi:hypothetical protein
MFSIGQYMPFALPNGKDRLGIRSHLPPHNLNPNRNLGLAPNPSDKKKIKIKIKKPPLTRYPVK